MKTIRNTICIVLLLILLFFTVNVNANVSTSLVNGQVYIDEDMNEILDDKDTVLHGIEVVLTKRVNNVVTESGLEIEEYEPVCTTVSDEKGYFTFEINEKELYRVKIKTNSLLPEYTYDRIDIDYESSLKDNYITLRLTKLPEKIYDVSKMTSIDLIDQAYDKAEITEDEKMWLYAKYYKDDELPERYRSDIEGPDKADIHFLLNQYIVMNDDKELDEYVHGIPQD